MLLYSIIIVVCAAIITTLNIFLNPQFQEMPWLYAILVLAFVVGAVLLDGLVALIIRKLPEKWFQEDKGIFKTSNAEMKFYRFLKVQKWKNHVPELGSFTGFHKNKVASPFDNEYIGRFILEARYGVAIHVWSVPTSFLLILCDFGLYTGTSNIWLTIALPVAAINAILIVLPAFVLKFNLPRLIAIYNNNIVLEKRQKDEQK